MVPTWVALDIYGDVYKACFCLLDYLNRFYIPTKKDDKKNAYEKLDIFIKTYFCYLEENKIPIEEIERLLKTLLTENFDRYFKPDWYVNVKYMHGTEEYENWKKKQDERLAVVFVNPAKQAVLSIEENNIPFSKEKLDLYENVALIYLSNQFGAKSKKYLSFKTGIKLDGELVTNEQEAFDAEREAYMSIEKRDIPDYYSIFENIQQELRERLSGEKQKKITK